MLSELEDSDEAVAARLKWLRKHFGLNKKQFAGRAGLSEQAYGPFENAQRPLSFSAAKKIRRAYDVPVEFLYFGKIGDLPHRIAKEL